MMMMMMNLTHIYVVKEKLIDLLKSEVALAGRTFPIHELAQTKCEPDTVTRSRVIPMTTGPAPSLTPRKVREGDGAISLNDNKQNHVDNVMTNEGVPRLCFLFVDVPPRVNYVLCKIFQPGHDGGVGARLLLSKWHLAEPRGDKSQRPLSEVDRRQNELKGKLFVVNIYRADTHTQCDESACK